MCKSCVSHFNFINHKISVQLFTEPPPINESRLRSDSRLNYGQFIGGILDGEEASYGGADYREAASG